MHEEQVLKWLRKFQKLSYMLLTLRTSSSCSDQSTVTYACIVKSAKYSDHVMLCICYFRIYYVMIEKAYMLFQHQKFRSVLYIHSINFTNLTILVMLSIFTNLTNRHPEDLTISWNTISKCCGMQEFNCRQKNLLWMIKLLMEIDSRTNMKMESNIKCQNKILKHTRPK